MQEGYQIIEIKNRVSDVLTQMSIKVSNVLTVLGQRCADSYQLIIEQAQIDYHLRQKSYYKYNLIFNYLFDFYD